MSILRVQLKRSVSLSPSAWLRLPVRRRWRFVVVFGVVFALIVGEIVFAYQTTVSNQAADDAVNYVEGVIALTNTATSALSDMESGYRGFLLTGDDTFLQPYAAGRQVYRDALRQLEQLTARNAAQVARWRSIEELAADWEAQLVEPNIELRRTLSNDQLGQLVPALRHQDDKQRIDQIRGIFGEAVAGEQRLLAQRRLLQSQEDARLLIVLTWGTAAATLLSLGLGAWILLHFERERLAGVWLAVQTSEHELYNRLCAARGHLELVLREPDLSARQRRWVERAHGSVVGATDVVGQMRTLPHLRQTKWSAESGVHTLKLDP